VSKPSVENVSPLLYKHSVWEIKTTVCEANETVNMQSNVLAKYAKCSYIFRVSKKQQY